MFKTTKAKIILVIIFSIICVTTTTLLIIYQNIDIEEKTDNIEETDIKKEKDVSGINLNGTYDQNDLEVEEKQISLEKVEIKYYQISGLKNKKIQENINNELEEIAKNIYKEKIKDLNKVTNVSVNSWVSGNFANILSIDISFYAKIDDDSDDFYTDSKCINYDLNTGKKIEFKELFTSDAPIEDILRDSSYYSLIEYRTEDNLRGDLVVNDYGEIEEEIAEIINLYKKNKIDNFIVSPDIIMIYENSEIPITIRMDKWADYIATYSRYLTTESLYEKNNIGYKNLYTLTNRYYDKKYCYYVNYQKEKNYFIDISIQTYSENLIDLQKNILDERIKRIEAEIEKIKQKTKQNPNLFYVVNYGISSGEIENYTTKEKMIAIYENGNTYEMTVHDFEENIEPIIREENRNYTVDAMETHIYNFEDILKIEPVFLEEHYNIETGEKIVI